LLRAGRLRPRPQGVPELRDLAAPGTQAGNDQFRARLAGLTWRPGLPTSPPGHPGNPVTLALRPAGRPMMRKLSLPSPFISLAAGVAGMASLGARGWLP